MPPTALETAAGAFVCPYLMRTFGDSSAFRIGSKCWRPRLEKHGPITSIPYSYKPVKPCLPPPKDILRELQTFCVCGQG